MRRSDQVEFATWLQERQSALLRAAKVICFDTQNAEDVLQEALADVCMRWSKVKKHSNMDIDHKNGNPQDNRISNLRIVHRSVNRAKH